MQTPILEGEFIQAYKSVESEKPSVTVDMLIFTVTERINRNIRKLNDMELKILLVKRKEPPFKGCWSLPGGFVGMEESLEDTVNRKLSEKAYIENIYLEQLYTYSDVKRDPRTRVISAAYMALVPSHDLVTEEHNEDAQWFRIQKEQNDNNMWTVKLTGEDDGTVITYRFEESFVQRGVLREPKAKVLEPEGERLAFDHAHMLIDALLRLKNKASYVPIAFNLVGELFTRAEIQSIYEILLDKKLTRVELWRRIKDMVVETEMMQDEKGHRPSRYYRFQLPEH